jgi:hypothetical protein
MNRRLLGYLVVNVIVSVVVIIIILVIYDRFFRPAAPALPPELSTSSPMEIFEVSGVGQLDTEMVTLGNSGTDRLSLVGWVLRDTADTEYTFPELSLLPGGSVNLHTAPGEDSASDLYWGRSRAVWQSGEYATLSDADGAVAAVYRVP